MDHFAPISRFSQGFGQKHVEIWIVDEDDPFGLECENLFSDFAKGGKEARRGYYDFDKTHGLESFHRDGAF